MNILFANFTKMVNDSGGVAKVACAFANDMVRRGHSVHLMHDDEKRGQFFYRIDEAVKLYNIRERGDGTLIKFPLHYKLLREFYRTFDKVAARTVNSNFNEKFLLQNIIKLVNEISPDIIVSYNPQGSKLLLCDMKTDIPVITMSHGDPGDYFVSYPKAELPSLPKSCICQVLMPSFEQKIKKHIPECNTITIGNAIPQFEYSADLSSDKSEYKIIFVGRLNRNHKRPHILLEAFAKLADKYPNWKVELWGAQERKEYVNQLKGIISKNGLEKRAFIMGSTDKVPEKLRDADIFAFPSAYEGFGMAVAEGMSVGLPVVAFKSCPAVNELVTDGITGVLCDDGVDAFAKALEKLMSDKNLRIDMGKAAKKDMQKYAPEKIWDQWEELLGKYKK